VEVKILDAKPRWTLIEYDDIDGMIQRKLLPECMTMRSEHKIGGTAEISQELLSFGVDTGSIDLTVVLGNQVPSMAIDALLFMLAQAGLWRGGLGSEYDLPEMDVLKLQDALRRVGIWSWQDYMGKPEDILIALEDLIEA
jgi:hypothetical protein